MGGNELAGVASLLSAPYNAALEQLVIPSVPRVVEAARAAVYAR